MGSRSPERHLNQTREKWLWASGNNEGRRRKLYCQEKKRSAGDFYSFLEVRMYD